MISKCALWLGLLLLFATTTTLYGFHDCIQISRDQRRKKRRLLHRHVQDEDEPTCAGGICIGMTNGPHEGGNASYPVSWNGQTGTYVEALMTVPPLPQMIDASTTYYLWTDIFFGDGEGGRMNQFVPQLILGSALDGSSGPPHYKPQWNDIHQTWSFAAHYFFELEPSTNNNNNNEPEAHAAYGQFYPAHEGEILRTTFELLPKENHSSVSSSKGDNFPYWKLTMEVEGDPSRRSTLVIEQPYMGMTGTSANWLEHPYRNMCLNSCWEIYGADTAAKLPSGGSSYRLDIRQSSGSFNFTTWERDEGNGECPSVTITEWHNTKHQTVRMDIRVDDADDETALL